MPRRAGCDAQVDRAPAGDTVVFVGDYVDRGPSARDVIESAARRCERSEAEMRFFQGQSRGHDAVLPRRCLDITANRFSSMAVRRRSTVTASREDELNDAESRLPGAHLGFYQPARHQLSAAAVFVRACRNHAARRARGTADVEDMLWIRQEFIFHPHQIGCDGGLRPHSDARR